MNGGLEKVHAAVMFPTSELHGRNNSEVSESRRRVKRQKLSAEVSLQGPQCQGLELTMAHASANNCEMDPFKDENNSKKSCDRTPEKSISSRGVAERGSLLPNDDDFFLSRRRPVCKEDLTCKLSDELILIIFRWLPKRTLVRCAFVCTRWRRIAYDESLWTKLDLGCRNLKPASLGNLLSRGVCALRLAQSEVKGPILPSPHPGIEERSFNKLQYLDLSMAVISGKDLADLLNTSKYLLKLSLEHCGVTDECCTGIASNEDLQVLNMCCCQGITAEGLKKILSGCRKLTELNLSWTGMKLPALDLLCKEVPETLTRLNISGSGKYLRDQHVHHLVKTCPHLIELDLSDCTSLTTSSIEHINNLKKLEHIALSRCYNIAASSFLLLSNLESLLYLDVFGLFPDQSVTHIKRNLPNIVINKFLFSSIARPTVGMRRTSIWGIKVCK